MEAEAAVRHSRLLRFGMRRSQLARYERRGGLRTRPRRRARTSLNPHSPSSQQASYRLVRLGRLGQIRLLSDRLFNPFAIDIAPRALMQLRRPRRRRPRRCSRLSSPGRAWAGGPCRKPKRRSRSGSISQMVARSLPARRLRRRDPR